MQWCYLYWYLKSKDYSHVTWDGFIQNNLRKSLHVHWSSVSNSEFADMIFLWSHWLPIQWKWNILIDYTKGRTIMVLKLGDPTYLLIAYS